MREDDPSAFPGNASEVDERDGRKRSAVVMVEGVTAGSKVG
jgi:hypothetical protein